MKERLFILSQYLLPHHLLSRLAGCLAEGRVRWIKGPIIRWFARRFDRFLVFGADGSVYEAGEPVWDEGRVVRAR